MSSDEHKVSLLPATLMVAGNIMGAGVFLLPASLAATGSIAIYGWAITIIGAVCLSLVYAKMAALDPSPGGSYAYARNRLGPFAGYQTNLFYWVSNAIGNIAIAMIGVDYVSYFIPVLKQPWVAAGTAVGLTWLFIYVNILGPRVVTRIQSVTTLFTLSVIIGVGLLSWLRFNPAIYMNSWDVKELGTGSAIQSVLNLTLWAFVGVETASVAAGVVKNPQKNVPIATVSGVLIAAVCYVLSCTAIMGVIPAEQLAKSAAPFADAARIAFGELGGAIVSFAAAIGALGALGGWIMATSLTAKAAADDGLFPKIFSKSNLKGSPVQGLIIVGIIMSLTAFLTISPTAGGAFSQIASIAVLLVLVAYLYVIASLLSFKRSYLISIIALLFCGWAVWGTKHSEAAWLAVFLLVSASLYAVSFHPKKDAHELKP